LRRFVLDLAVRGKLVEQDAGDEPAAALLKRIEQEKARLVKAGEAKKSKESVPLDENDLPYSLPSSWTWTQISRIGFISPRNEAPDDFEASFVPMPLIFAEYGVANKHDPRPWGAIKKGYTHFAEGDVGLAKITPCFENRKSTVFRGLTGGLGSGTTELHIVRPVYADGDYIVLFLKCPHFIETGIPKMTGTAGQKRVPTEYFTSSPFPLPPLAEQHRIVAKVDELMALCDQLEQARAGREAVRDRLTTASVARLTAPEIDAETFQSHAHFTLQSLPTLTTRPDQIKTLRQTILNLAVRGKLVAQDPSDEPAAELLARIAKSRAQERRRKGTFMPVSEEEVTFSPPTGWAWVRFGEVFHIRTGFAFKSPTYTESGVLVFRVVNFDRSGAFDLSDVKYFPESLIDEKLAGFSLEEGEILMVMVGGTIGKTTRVTSEILPALLNQNMWRIRSFGKSMSNDYEYLLIRMLNQIIENLTNSTHGHFAMGDFEQKLICIPPFAEQHRIVAKVDALMTLCDQLEASLTTTATTRSKLLNALLHEALEPATETAHA
jgi:type I restriction enzyme S subunit